MCLPTSFAMVLDVPLDEIFAEIGHDGSADQSGQQLPEPCAGEASIPRS